MLQKVLQKKFNVKISTIYATAKHYVSENTGSYNCICLKNMKKKEAKILSKMRERFKIAEEKAKGKNTNGM